jgi:hypothetical protein
MGRLMDFDFDAELNPTHNPDDRKAFLFNKPYVWVKEEGRLTLVPTGEKPTLIDAWSCCGRPRVL